MQHLFDQNNNIHYIISGGGGASGDLPALSNDINYQSSDLDNTEWKIPHTKIYVKKIIASFGFVKLNIDNDSNITICYYGPNNLYTIDTTTNKFNSIFLDNNHIIHPDNIKLT